MTSVVREFTGGVPEFGEPGAIPEARGVAVGVPAAGKVVAVL